MWQKKREDVNYKLLLEFFYNILLLMNCGPSKFTASCTYGVGKTFVFVSFCKYIDQKPLLIFVETNCAHPENTSSVALLNNLLSCGHTITLHFLRQLKTQRLHISQVLQLQLQFQLSTYVFFNQEKTRGFIEKMNRKANINRIQIEGCKILKFLYNVVLLLREKHQLRRVV